MDRNVWQQRRIPMLIAVLALVATLPALPATAQEPPTTARVEVLRIARLTSQRQAIEVRTRVFCGPGDEIIQQNFLVNQSRGEVGSTGIGIAAGVSCPTPPEGTVTMARVFPRFPEGQFGLGRATVRTNLVGPRDDDPVSDDLIAEAEADVLVIPDLGLRGSG